MIEPPIVAVFGDPAAGKTFWRKRIANHLGWQDYDIAALGEVGTERWPWLMRKLTTDAVPAVVESCVCPSAYRALLTARPSLIVNVTAPKELRRQRLKERHLEPKLERKLLRIHRAPPRAADVTITPWSSVSSVLEAIDIGSP